MYESSCLGPMANDPRFDTVLTVNRATAALTVCKIRFAVVATLFIAGAFTDGLAAEAVPAQPVIRDGSCPSGYSSSGNYCVPGSSARYALPRSGSSCPSGYFSSGNYCVAASKDSRLAIPRRGSCPSGYFSSGDFCVAAR